VARICLDLYSVMFATCVKADNVSLEPVEAKRSPVSSDARHPLFGCVEFFTD